MVASSWECGIGLFIYVMTTSAEPTEISDTLIMLSAKNNWDFWTSLPEALHQVTIVMSDRGIPATYRHMLDFGSHTAIIH